MQDTFGHGLRTPREEIAFTAWPKIQSQSQIFRYGRSIFCLPHRPNFSDIYDLCLRWLSIVRVVDDGDGCLCTYLFSLLVNKQTIVQSNRVWPNFDAETCHILICMYCWWWLFWILNIKENNVTDIICFELWIWW